MRIHLIIEIEPDGVGTVKRVKPATVKLAEIAETVPVPITPEPKPEPERIDRAGSGPQFDPGFMRIILDAVEPFTRRSIAVASGLKVEDVTQRLIRLNKHGWIEQPAPGLWRKTKTFGEKP
jgi:hypothetical protein